MFNWRQELIRYLAVVSGWVLLAVALVPVAAVYLVVRYGVQL